jgi:hypothetical protein
MTERHYIVDLLREQYMTIGEVISCALERGKISRKQVIYDMEGQFGIVDISINFITQICADKSRIPLNLITPLVQVAFQDEMEKIREYYCAEIFRAYMPDNIGRLIKSPLNSLKIQADAKARAWMMDQGKRRYFESKADELNRDLSLDLFAYQVRHHGNSELSISGLNNGLNNYFEFEQDVKSGIKPDFHRFEAEDLAINDYVPKHASKGALRKAALVNNAQRLKAIAAIDHYFENPCGRVDRCTNALRPGESFNVAIDRIRNGSSLLLATRFQKNGSPLPDHVMLALLATNYEKSKLPGAAPIESLLAKYNQDVEASLRERVLEGGTYEEIWVANRISQPFFRAKIIRDHEDKLVDNPFDLVCQYFEHNQLASIDAKMATQKFPWQVKYLKFRKDFLSLTANGDIHERALDNLGFALEEKTLDLFFDLYATDGVPKMARYNLDAFARDTGKGEDDASRLLEYDKHSGSYETHCKHQDLRNDFRHSLTCLVERHMQDYKDLW